MTDPKGKCVQCGADSPDGPLCDPCEDIEDSWTWICTHGGCKAVSQEEFTNVFDAKAAALKHGEQHCCPHKYTLGTLGPAVTREQWEQWRGIPKSEIPTPTPRLNRVPPIV